MPRGSQHHRCEAAFGGLIALNYGWASFTTARDFDPNGRGGEVAALLKTLPVADYPLTVSAADDFGAYGSDAHYTFALDQVLTGLRATARPSAPTRPSGSPAPLDHFRPYA